MGEERWVYELAPQLSGRARQAYVAMTPEEAGNYERVKAAILRRYKILANVLGTIQGSYKGQ